MYLCRHYIGYENRTVDLYGILNALQPEAGYPLVKTQLCAFTQLVNGLGRVAVHVDTRSASTGELIYSTNPKFVEFKDRMTITQVEVFLRGYRFDRPGRYLFELFCDNIWVCDTQLDLE